MNIRQLFTLFLPLSETFDVATTARVSTSTFFSPLSGSCRPETITQASSGFGHDEIPTSERHVGLLSNDIEKFFDLFEQYFQLHPSRLVSDKIVLPVLLEDIDKLKARIIMLQSGMTLRKPLLLSDESQYAYDIKFLEDLHKGLIIAQKKDCGQTSSLPPIASNAWDLGLSSF